jgi:nickel/cobalt exporter
MKRLALLVIFALLAVTLSAQVTANPFTARGSRPHRGFFHVITSQATAALANAMAPLQRTMNEELAALTRSLQGSRSLGGLLFVILISLAYGAFHAAGPGHGKTVVSSYFLANNARLRHSVAIGYLIAAVHSLAALSVVLVLYYLIRGLFSANVEQANRYIQLVTFSAITLIGAFMLVARIRGGPHHHHLHLHAGHDHAGESGHAGDSGQAMVGPHGVSFRRLVGIAVPAGAIPCPGAVAVTLFALSLHLLSVSILSVVSISLGMGATISATGIIVILAKQGMLKVAAGRTERETVLRRIMEIGGAALLLLFGLAFLLAQF